jgi:DNA-binding XRE family transcriptional regulator
MARIKIETKSHEDFAKQKRVLYEKIMRGELTLGQATRQMRLLVGMTIPDYAKKVLKISERVLLEIENDKGNPRKSTLLKIGKPFGLTIGFIAPISSNDGAIKEE